MDHTLTFAILLYFNIFYFGMYAAIEFFLLVFKYFNLSQYDSGVLFNELCILTFLVAVEGTRLLIGQQSSEDHKRLFEKGLSQVFHILVLTVPSMYAVAYFVLWQTFVTRLEAVFGGILLIIQAAQFLSAALNLLPRIPRLSKTFFGSTNQRRPHKPNHHTA